MEHWLSEADGMKTELLGLAWDRSRAYAVTGQQTIG
jgi:hypothetical protein